MLSMVPGFDRPNASRRSANDRYVSRRAETTAFSFMKPMDVVFSSAMSEKMREWELALCLERCSDLPQTNEKRMRCGPKRGNEKEGDGRTVLLAQRVQNIGQDLEI